jgi:hypothetical protein
MLMADPASASRAILIVSPYRKAHPDQLGQNPSIRKMAVGSGIQQQIAVMFPNCPAGR